MKFASMLGVTCFTVAGLALSVGAARPAFAVTAAFDFLAIADGASFLSTSGTRVGFEGNWNRPDLGDPLAPAVVGDGAGIIVNGITVYAEGNNSSGIDSDAFLDSNLAGLGVCSSWSCRSGVDGSFTGDDNLNRSEESLTLTFSEEVTLTEVTIRNADHDPANGSFTFMGEVFTVTDGAVDPAALALLAPATSFTLEYILGGPEIYVSKIVAMSAVPLPAGALLLGSALAALGLWTRRRALG